MDKYKTVKDAAGDEVPLARMGVNGFSCNCCGADVKIGDFAFICPDCGAVVCEACAQGEPHGCDPDDEEE